MSNKNKPIPLNKRLYEKVKAEARLKFKVFPSAYASGWLVREYKKRGGTYSGKKPKDTGLSRWYEEKWINVCELPKIVRCGRKSTPLQTWIKQYPYCRPYKKVTSKTPKTVSELSASELKRRCKQKRKNPLKRVN
jgi:hypothetical protein